MTRPSAPAPWANDANYPADAAPEAGSPTKIALAHDQDTIGARPDGIPTAQEENWWRNLVGKWTAFLFSLFDADDNLVMPEDASVVVSGDGRYRHGTLTMVLDAKLGSAQGFDTPWVANYGGVHGDDPIQWHLPVPLPVGKRITAIRCRVKDSAVGPTKWQITVFEAYDDNAPVDIGGGTFLSSGAGTKQTATFAGIDYTMVAGRAVVIDFTPNSLISGDPMDIYQTEVDYDDLLP
jgi:hypothetical protein